MRKIPARISQRSSVSGRREFLRPKPINPVTKKATHRRSALRETVGSAARIKDPLSISPTTAATIPNRATAGTRLSSASRDHHDSHATMNEREINPSLALSLASTSIWVQDAVRAISDENIAWTPRSNPEPKNPIVR